SITIRGSEKLNGVWKKVSNLTMDDLAIDGIRLNMKYNEAAKLLGLKDQLVFDEIPQEDDVPLVKDIQKNGLEMTFYTYSDALDKATLVEIHIKDMQYNTFRGIKIGDSYDKVKSLYQNPDDENKDKISYYLGPFTLSFKLGDGKVKQIDLMSEYG
ncbi:MAG: hypothetical protein Q8920_17175, partial [Bacillota bacterium]|nr:hypothetical protein [Bacillota bacterium]